MLLEKFKFRLIAVLTIYQVIEGRRSNTLGMIQPTRYDPMY